MDLKQKILEAYKNGNIVVSTPFGLEVHDLKEFIKQPADGILFDLNRDECTILTIMKADEEAAKWVNDLASSKTIRALKEKINELEAKIIEQKQP